MTDFPYTTLQTLLDLHGLDLSTLDARRQRAIITNIGTWINQITGQWFLPVAATLYADGNGDTLCRSPKGLPIIKLDSLKVIYDRTNDRDTFPTKPYYATGSSWHSVLGSCDQVLIEGSDYVIKTDLRSRVVERIDCAFPGGANNIEFVGTFGLVDNPRTVTVTTTAAITAASTSVTLDSVVGLFELDVFFLNGRAVLISTIDPATNTITFDAPAFLGSATIASGEVLTICGSVPDGIKTVASFLVNQFVAKNNVLDGGPAVPAAAGGIKREKDGEYSIEFFNDNPAGNTKFATAMLTGDPIMEQILYSYAKPLYADFA